MCVCFKLKARPRRKADTKDKFSKPYILNKGVMEYDSEGVGVMAASLKKWLKTYMAEMEQGEAESREAERS